MYFEGKESAFPIRWTQCQSVRSKVEGGIFQAHMWNFQFFQLDGVNAFASGDQCFKVFLRVNRRYKMESETFEVLKK